MKTLMSYALIASLLFQAVPYSHANDPYVPHPTYEPPCGIPEDWALVMGTVGSVLGMGGNIFLTVGHVDATQDGRSPDAIYPLGMIASLSGLALTLGGFISAAVQNNAHCVVDHRRYQNFWMSMPVEIDRDGAPRFTSISLRQLRQLGVSRSDARERQRDWNSDVPSLNTAFATLVERHGAVVANPEQSTTAQREAFQADFRELIEEDLVAAVSPGTLALFETVARRASARRVSVSLRGDTPAVAANAGGLTIQF